MDEKYWLNIVKYGFINEEINRNVFLEWVNEFNIEKVYTGLPLWPKMSGRKNQRISQLSDQESIPYSLSSEMYIKYNGSRVLVSHFYGENLNHMDEREIEDFFTDRGMNFYWLSYDESWLNPGVSISIVVEIEDEDIYLNYIKSHSQYDSKNNVSWI